MSGGDFSDRHMLLRSNSSASDGDLESQGPSRSNKGIQDLLKRLDRGFLGGRNSIKRLDRHQPPFLDHGVDGSGRSDEILGDSAPPEWALLLIGCLLGLATRLCVAAFNRGHYYYSNSKLLLRHMLTSRYFIWGHVIHEWAWAGTPNEGAAWLCLQRLADTWHRILLIPVTGGVIVGMMHGLLEILEQIKQSTSSQGQGFDLLAGVFPTVKAIQAAVTLGTGCSLGPEGPSVDIGKSCAHGCSIMMENNRGRRIAFVAAGEAAGIASGAGIIALKYPGILYRGFTNVDEILRTGKSASAPGIWLLAQLATAKVVATSSCKGSGLVGGLYAPSLMIGAAVRAVFGGSAAELINSAIPGNAAVAQPQAYALVGMATTLASVCSVPLTSILLLFELTKDDRILLPFMGAVGLAIWVPSVANQSKETEASDARSSPRGYSFLSPVEDKNEDMWRRIHDGDHVELCVIGNGTNHEAIDEDMFLEDLKVSQAMPKNYVRVSPALTLNDATKCMHDAQQHCALVVDAGDLLEVILTHGDIKRFLSDKSGDASEDGSSLPDLNTCLVSSICTHGISYHGQERGLLTCYPDTNLAIVKKLMEAKGIKQLPVVKHGGEFQRTRKQRIVAILHYDSIWNCLREEINRRESVYQQRKEGNA